MNNLNEFEWRDLKFTSLMDKRKLDVLLIYSYPLTGHIWSNTNFDTVYWISNYDMLGNYSMVILPKSGAPVLLISEAWDLDRAKEKSWIKDVRVTTKLWEDCKEILRRDAPSRTKNRNDGRRISVCRLL